MLVMVTDIKNSITAKTILTSLIAVAFCLFELMLWLAFEIITDLNTNTTFETVIYMALGTIGCFLGALLTISWLWAPRRNPNKPIR